MPRPKPRICKPKPYIPTNEAQDCVFGLVAQSSAQQHVSICVPDAVAAAATPKPARKPVHSNTHSNPRGQAALKSRKPGHLQKRPKATPGVAANRPTTPLPLQPQQNVIIQDPLCVAESIASTPMEAASVGLAPRENLKKRPFSKISEPAKVAVSYTSQPWGLCAPFKGQLKAEYFSAEIPHYSVFADLHLPLVQKSEVTLQCPVIGLQKVVATPKTSSRGTSATTPTPPLPLTAKARAIVTSLRRGPASVHTPVICECPEVYQAQLIESFPFQEPSPSAYAHQQNVPSRFAGTASRSKAAGSSGGISRFGASRSSIKLPGVKFSPIPTSHRKRPVPNLDLNFHLVAISREPPLIFEKICATVKGFCPRYVKAKSVLWCPEMKTASVLQQPVLDRVIKDTTLSCKLPNLLTLPLRTLVLHPGFVQVNQTVTWSGTEVLPAEKSIMPQKEYPYYSPVRKTSSILEMMKAKEIPKVEVSWLAPERPKTPSILVAQVKQLVPPEMKSVLPEVKGGASVAKAAKKSVLLDPELHWAAMRCEFDPCVMASETRPMENLPSQVKAKTMYHKSMSDFKYR